MFRTPLLYLETIKATCGKAPGLSMQYSTMWQYCIDTQHVAVAQVRWCSAAGKMHTTGYAGPTGNFAGFL